MPGLSEDELLIVERWQYSNCGDRQTAARIIQRLVKQQEQVVVVTDADGPPVYVEPADKIVKWEPKDIDEAAYGLADYSGRGTPTPRDRSLAHKALQRVVHRLRAAYDAGRQRGRGENLSNAEDSIVRLNNWIKDLKEENEDLKYEVNVIKPVDSQGDLLSPSNRHFVESRRQILKNERKGYEPEWLELVDELAPRPPKAPQIAVDQLDANELHCIEELKAVLPPFGNPDYVDIHCYADNVLNIFKRRFPQLK